MVASHQLTVLKSQLLCTVAGVEDLGSLAASSAFAWHSGMCSWEIPAHGQPIGCAATWHATCHSGECIIS